jgi:hypothetical protein
LVNRPARHSARSRCLSCRAKCVLSTSSALRAVERSLSIRAASDSLCRLSRRRLPAFQHQSSVRFRAQRRVRSQLKSKRATQMPIPNLRAHCSADWTSMNLDRMTPAQRSLRARVAAHERWAKQDPRAGTQRARDAANARFEHLADPDNSLSPEERARRAESLRRAHFLKMALASSRARRRNRGPV